MVVLVSWHYIVFVCLFFFFFKQKTAYEMRISDWSSDVCSSDLFEIAVAARHVHYRRDGFDGQRRAAEIRVQDDAAGVDRAAQGALPAPRQTLRREHDELRRIGHRRERADADLRAHDVERSEEHTSELQSLMRISYAVLCLKKKKRRQSNDNKHN